MNIMSIFRDKKFKSKKERKQVAETSERASLLNNKEDKDVKPEPTRESTMEFQERERFWEGMR